MKSSRLAAGFAGLAAAALTLAGCGSEGSNDPLKDDNGGGSADSGTITVYTSEPDTDFAELVKAFNEKYPKITVKSFRSGTEQIQSKLEAENKAGSAQADVVFIADALTMENFKQLKLLAKYTPSDASSIDKKFADPEGYYIGTKIITTGIAINTNKVKTPPTSWFDLTKPALKNKVQLASPLYSGAAAYNLVTLAADPSLGWKFWTELAGNKASLAQGNGAVAQSVATGQKSYGMVVDYLVARNAKEGSPLKFVYPREGVPAITEPIALASGAKSSKPAKTFIDFVLSDAGQKVASKLGYVPIEPDAPVPNGLRGISSLKVIDGDVVTLAKQVPAAKSRFSKSFGTK